MSKLRQGKTAEVCTTLYSLQPLTVLVRSQILDSFICKLQTYCHLHGTILAHHAHRSEVEVDFVNVCQHLTHWQDVLALMEIVFQLSEGKDASFISSHFQILRLKEKSWLICHDFYIFHHQFPILLSFVFVEYIQSHKHFLKEVRVDVCFFSHDVQGISGVLSQSKLRLI